MVAVVGESMVLPFLGQGLLVPTKGTAGKYSFHCEYEYFCFLRVESATEQR